MCRAITYRMYRREIMKFGAFGAGADVLWGLTLEFTGCRRQSGGMKGLGVMPLSKQPGLRFELAVCAAFGCQCAPGCACSATSQVMSKRRAPLRLLEQLSVPVHTGEGHKRRSQSFVRAKPLVRCPPTDGQPLRAVGKYCSFLRGRLMVSRPPTDGRPSSTEMSCQRASCYQGGGE